MTVVGVVRRSAYFDSVALMLAQREARELPGVEEVGVVMATDANKALLRDAGLDFPDLSAAGPDDLAIVARAATRADAEAAVARAEETLTRRRAAAASAAAAPGAAGAGTPGAVPYRPRTIATARRVLPDASLVLVSVPGRFAKGVAVEALDAGLHVMVFSDNVPLEHEVELKRRSAARGLLCMGPDCGTAVIGGAALGFANRVRAGGIGLVGAAGTGLQEVMSLIHRSGGGITHAIGTGGRDLSAAVGGVTMLQGLRALAADERSQVIVLVSKPPAPEVAERVLAAAAACGKPVVAAFVGADIPRRGRVVGASTLDDAARIAVHLANGSGAEASGAARRGSPAGVPVPRHSSRRPSAGRYLRGLFSGGTLCYEALVLLRPHLGRIWSNTPLAPDEVLEPVTRSREHTVIDMGGDEFTQGRLHPMLDPTLRLQRLRQEAADPDVGVILLDVVLGYGAHPDPAGALAPMVREVLGAARAAGRDLAVVGSVCGTDDDPQRASAQRRTLEAAGMLVAESNARAARLAARALGVPVPEPEVGPAAVAAVRGRGSVAAEGSAAAASPTTGVARPAGREAAGVTGPEVEPILAVLRDRPAVINVGLELFAESLAAQGVPVVSVDWRPPAGGRTHVLDLLDRLEA